MTWKRKWGKRRDVFATQGAETETYNVLLKLLWAFHKSWTLMNLLDEINYFCKCSIAYLRNVDSSNWINIMLRIWNMIQNKNGWSFLECNIKCNLNKTQDCMQNPKMEILYHVQKPEITIATSTVYSYTLDVISHL